MHDGRMNSVAPKTFASNFFEDQDRARRRTGLLVFLFVLAVVLTVVASYFVIATAWMSLVDGESGTAGGTPAMNPFGLPSFLLISFGITAMIGIASLVKMSQLGGSGAKVAQMLGGTLVLPGSTDPDERKLLNIVEEMSIASGVPVPPVYVMNEETGINGFAAGTTLQNAVIAVTRGTMVHLSREELQGVIAHEYSHILNGDMRLNLRLIGSLFGLMMLGLLGRMIIEGFARGGVRTSRRSGDSKDGGGGGAIVVIILAAIALYVVGSIGIFFGKLIKAAVSRQREFLADAAAVQFTRNPEGLANALRKIGGISGQGQLRSAKAEEASHMFFADGVKRMFSGAMMATHPPLAERIRQINPTWDGSYLDVQEQGPLWQSGTPAVERGRGPAGSVPLPIPGMPGSGFPGMPRVGVPAMMIGLSNPADVLSRAGRPDGAALEAAQLMLAQIPDAMRAMTKDGDGAQILALALIAAQGSAFGAVEREIIRTFGGESAVTEAGKLRDQVLALGPAARLPMFELCLPALKSMDAMRRDALLKAVEALTLADQRISFGEFIYSKLLERHLSAMQPRRGATQFYSISGMMPGMPMLLSALAWAGQNSPEAARAAYESGMRSLEDGEVPPMASRNDIRFAMAGGVLDRASQATGHVRQRVLSAVLKVAMHDHRLEVQEYELLRAVAELMEVPLPPLPVSRDGGA